MRKAGTNARLFASTSWTILMLAILAFFAFIRFRRAHDLQRIIAENPAFGAALAAAFSAGIVGFFTEDTGIKIPTFMLIPAAIGAVWLVLSAIETAEHAEQQPGVARGT